MRNIYVFRRPISARYCQVQPRRVAAHAVARNSVWVPGDAERAATTAATSLIDQVRTENDILSYENRSRAGRDWRRPRWWWVWRPPQRWQIPSSCGGIRGSLFYSLADPHCDQYRSNSILEITPCRRVSVARAALHAANTSSSIHVLLGTIAAISGVFKRYFPLCSRSSVFS